MGLTVKYPKYVFQNSHVIFIKIHAVGSLHPFWGLVGWGFSPRRTEKRCFALSGKSKATRNRALKEVFKIPEFTHLMVDGIATPGSFFSLILL